MPLGLIECCFGQMLIDNCKWYDIMKLKATKTVIIMIFVYIICWRPLMIYYSHVWLCQKCFPASYMAYDQWISQGIGNTILVVVTNNIFHKNRSSHKQKTDDGKSIICRAFMDQFCSE